MLQQQCEGKRDSCGNLGRLSYVYILVDGRDGAGALVAPTSSTSGYVEIEHE